MYSNRQSDRHPDSELLGPKTLSVTLTLLQPQTGKYGYGPKWRRTRGPVRCCGCHQWASWTPKNWARAAVKPGFSESTRLCLRYFFSVSIIKHSSHRWRPRDWCHSFTQIKSEILSEHLSQCEGACSSMWTTTGLHGTAQCVICLCLPGLLGNVPSFMSFWEELLNSSVKVTEKEGTQPQGEVWTDLRGWVLVSESRKRRIRVRVRNNSSNIQ